MAALWSVMDARAARRIRAGDFAGLGLDRVVSELMALYGQGVVVPAQLERLPEGTPTPFTRNSMVCLAVAAGRYQLALEWSLDDARWAEQQWLIAINRGEALACLGQLEAALTATELETPPLTDFVRGGLAAHRAWVLAELGRTAEARSTLDGSPHQSLGPYEAEWFFSRFAIEFADRQWAAAAAALNDAQRVAVRASTRRNLHFLRGRLSHAQGRWAEAVTHFEAGAAQTYRWQGGPALLDWGDALVHLGRPEAARVAWTRCTEQDPESPAAEVARARLAAR